LRAKVDTIQQHKKNFAHEKCRPRLVTLCLSVAYNVTRI